MTVTPDWLQTLSIIAIALAIASTVLIAADILLGRRQPMAIMNAVWPLTALYAGPVAVWAYWRVGRPKAMAAHGHAHPDQDGGEPPRWRATALAATHCGSGCTLGDPLAEGLFLPLVPVTLFGHALFGAWAVDFVFAFLIGIAFQYFTIAPMRQQSRWRSLVAALKADTLSLTAWQVGMYGWMAIAVFGLFGHELDPATPVFWFMMQIAMIAGFLTSLPVNAWLLRAGIKEAM